MTAAETISIEPLQRPPEVTVTPPGSKSLTNRALILATLADGRSTITGALRADDTEAMIEALESIGVGLSVDWARHEITVTPPLGEPAPSSPRVMARQSGTTARFVLPALAVLGIPATLDGAEQLRRRPIAPLVDSLRTLDVDITYVDGDGFLPLTVDGRRARGGTVVVDAGYSSQYLSALLLSAARFPGGLHVHLAAELVAAPFVQLTLEVLEAFGVEVTRAPDGSFVIAEQPVRSCTYHVEPDATAASYFFAAAMITGGSITVAGLGKTSRQGDLAFLDVLERMGAEVIRRDDSITVIGGSIRAIDVDLRDLPDTALTLAAVAVFADGPTRVRGVEYIRGHETDRIAAVVAELRRLGVGAHETQDGFVVEPRAPRPGVVATYGDHRMAMSFSLVGLRARGIVIADPTVVDKTYPDFFRDLALLRGDRS